MRNPLGRATDADLQEQFTLASQISAKVSAANEAVAAHPRAKDQIERAERQGQPMHESRRPPARLTHQLTDVEGEIYQYRNRSSQDPLNFPDQVEQQARGAAG